MNIWRKLEANASSTMNCKAIKPRYDEFYRSLSKISQFLYQEHQIAGQRKSGLPLRLSHFLTGCLLELTPCLSAGKALSSFFLY